MSTQQTLDAYNLYHDIYDQEVLDFWNNFPTSTVDAFRQNLSGKKVLNVGSGSGRDALLLRKSGLDVVCVDGAEEMVRATKRLGFESHLQTFDALEFPQAEFDGAWVYTSLIHVPPAEAKAALAKIATFIRPHGTLLMGVILGNGAKIVERGSMPGAQRLFQYYQVDEITSLVESSGYQLVFQDEYQPHNTVYLNQVYKLA